MTSRLAGWLGYSRLSRRANPLHVSDILERNKVPPDNALPDVLGDQYLYRENSYFRNVRDLCLTFGYTYCDKDSPLWRSYQVFPLASLQSLIDAKQIPYIGNAQALADVAAVNPSLELSLPFLLKVFKRNFLMHESAHAIASSVLGGYEDTFLDELPKNTASVVRALLSEAFANTVERISSHQALSTRHALYYSLNAYIPYRRSEVTAIAQLIDRFGCKAIFSLGYSLYFFSNVYSRPLIDAELEAFSSLIARDLIPASESTSDLAKLLLANRFSVNPAFRHGTNVMYFDMHACGGEYSALVDAPSLLSEGSLRMLKRVGEMFSMLAEVGTAAAAFDMDTCLAAGVQS